MSAISVLNSIVKNRVKSAMYTFKMAIMKTNRRCPECDGTNLNWSIIKCYDCSASDYCS